MKKKIGRRRGSLAVVGTGINAPAQTTFEAVAYMQRAEKLFYMVTDPATEQWLRQLNRTATSLADLYADGKERRKTYMEMTERLVSAVRGGFEVCAAFYGHPGVLVTAAHLAIRRVRREGYAARMAPGVSAEACLIADLGVNPGDQGLQSFEATDFLRSRRQVDPTSGLILWQVGVLGESVTRRGTIICRPERLEVLANALRKYYPARHRLVLYEAASFAAHRPVTIHVALDRLPRVKVRQLAMLYVPSLPRRPADRRIARWYDEK